MADFARYLWRLTTQQKAGSIPAVFSLALTILSAAFRKPIGLSVWEWALVLEASMIFAGFLDWRRSSEMPAEHAHVLKESARSLRKSIDGGSSCCYETNPNQPDRHAKQMFREHYPELAEPLDKWDSVCAQYQASEESSVDDAGHQQLWELRRDLALNLAPRLYAIEVASSLKASRCRETCVLR